MAVPDPGLAVYGAEMPCWTRRRIIDAAQEIVLADHGMFPKDGQYVDTPANIARRTTDTEY